MQIEIEDETQNNSKIRELTFIKYFDIEADKKLQVLNRQDDSASCCWSDSLNSVPRSHHHSQIIQEDFSEIQQENNKFQEIQQERKQMGQYEIDRQSNLLRPKSQSQQQSTKSKAHQVLNEQRQTSKETTSQWQDSNSKYKQNVLIFDRKYQNEEEDKLSNTLHTFRNIKTEISQMKKQQGDSVNNILKIDIRLISFLKLKIQRFINTFTIHGRTKLLNNKIRYEINDLSDILHTYHQKINWRFLFFPFKIISKMGFLQKIPLIIPQSRIGFIIKLIFAALNCIFLYFFSLILIYQGFQAHLQKINIVVKLIWSIEVILKLNSQPYSNQIKFNSHASIMYNYLKNNFIFDLLPLIVMKETSSNQLQDIIFQFFIFLKAVNLLKDCTFIQKQICMRIKRYYLVQLINLIFKLFLFAHIIACTWYILGLFEQKVLRSQTWFEDVIINDDRQWWQYYIWSIYWALTLMTTGSNTATSNFQAFYTSFIMLFTTIVFGYSLNVIGMILSEMEETQRQQRKDVNIINEYMRYRHISQNLQAKVNMNLEHYYQNNFKKLQEDNQSVLEKISQELKNQLLTESNKQLLNKMQFLQKNFSSEVLDELSLFVKEEYYLPNQIIHDSNIQLDSFVMYVYSGSVEVISQTFHDNQIKQSKRLITENQIYGEISFFTGLKSGVVLQSKEFTKVLKIERENFMRIIKNKEKDYEVFCQIKDKIMLYNEYGEINVICKLCNISTHLTCNCTNVLINKQIIYQKVSWLQSRQQFRKTMPSNKKKQKLNTLNLLNFHQNKAKEARNLIQYLPANTYLRIQQLQDITYSSQDENGESDQTNNQVAYEESIIQQEYLTRKTFEQQQTFPKVEHHLYTQNSSATYDNPAKTKNELSVNTQNDQSEAEIEAIVHLDNLKSILKEQTDPSSSSKQFSESLKSIKKRIRNEIKNTLRRDISEKYPPSLQILELINNYKEISEQERNQYRNYPRLSVPKKNVMKQKLNQIAIESNEQTERRLSVKPELKKSQQNIVINAKIDSYDLNNQSYRFNIFEEEREYLEQYWEFDSLKDFKYYFTYGNSKYQILRHQRILKRKMKKSKKKMKHEISNI